MYIVRLVKPSDLEAFEKCASSAGIGITNLPRKPELIKKEIRASMRSCDKNITKPQDEDYLFVLTDEHCIKGTSGIYSHIGKRHPFHVFRVENVAHQTSLPAPSEIRILRATRYPKGPSEICALYLLPELRKEGYGKLLSLSRFLFMATFPERFESIIIANMRGFVENEESHFWEGLGKFFLPLSFKEIIAMRSLSERFIKTFLPKYPIYVMLLSKETQKVIGEVHSNTVPAMQMLFNEGFSRTPYIDPIDGGPIIAAEKLNIRSVVNSEVAKINEISSSPFKTEKFIICNNRIDFRACYGHLKKIDEGVILETDTAHALQVKQGDNIRYLKLLPC
jgi:arginine N-succinyltransferase